MKIKARYSLFHIIEEEFEKEIEIEDLEQLNNLDWMDKDLKLDELFETYNSELILPDANIGIGNLLIIEISGEKYIYIDNVEGKKIVEPNRTTKIKDFYHKYSELEKIEDLKSFIRNTKINQIINEK